MSGEAISSKGVAMYLSVGDAVTATVIPTGITKAKPTAVTAPPPAAIPGQPIGILTVAAGAATVLTVSPADYALIGATITLAGGVGEWTALNGAQTVTKTVANTFTVPVDSSAFVDPVPAPGSISGTLPSVPGVYNIGDIVVPKDTGFRELDGSYFVIQTVTVDGFTMLGADTSQSTGSLAPGATMEIFRVNAIVKMCLNNFAFNLETPGTVAAGTYCNPQATLPATATAVGTATLGGWIDKSDPAYQELLKAEMDGYDRVFVIALPQNQGVIIAAMVITGVTWDIPLEGGMAFTASGNLSTKPKHLF
jgi:hypothetical protein